MFTANEIRENYGPRHLQGWQKFALPTKLGTSVIFSLSLFFNFFLIQARQHQITSGLLVCLLFSLKKDASADGSSGVERKLVWSGLGEMIHS